MNDRTAAERTREIRKAWSPVERYLRAVEGRRRQQALIDLVCDRRRAGDATWDPAEWAVGAMSIADVRRLAV